MSFGQALLNWTTAFPNFARIAQDQQWFGWSQATVAEPCSWTGVSCTAQSAELRLPRSGLTGRPLSNLLQVLVTLSAAAATCTYTPSPRYSLHRHVITVASHTVKPPYGLSLYTASHENAQHRGQHEVTPHPAAAEA